MTTASHSALVDAAVALAMTKAQRRIARHCANLPCQTNRESDTFAHTIKILQELTPCPDGIHGVARYEEKEANTTQV